MTNDLEPTVVPPSTTVHIHNNVDANAHIWRVVATFLIITGSFGIAWGLAQWGMLELAATGTAAVLSMLAQLLLRNGIIVLPESKSDDERIEAGKSALRAIVGMVQATIDRSSLLRLVLIAIGYGIAFILVRTAVKVVLSAVIGNLAIALGIGAIIAAFICFPTLLAGTVRALKARTVTR